MLLCPKNVSKPVRSGSIKACYISTSQRVIRGHLVSVNMLRNETHDKQMCTCSLVTFAAIPGMRGDAGTCNMESVLYHRFSYQTFFYFDVPTIDVLNNR